MKPKNETKAYSALRIKGALGTILAPLVTVFAIGCVPPSTPGTPEPSAQQVFQPDPGTLTDGDGLTLNIQNLDGKTVCYGSNALINTDGGSCQFGQETTSGTIELSACTAGQTIKLSFIGNNGTPVSIAGTFDTSNYSDCDGDNDGIANSTDNCPDIANTNQADHDNDGMGNACDDDDDNDGINDADDNCPFAANADQDPEACSGQADTDNDLIPDSADNCPNVWNRNQGDDDGDGTGNVCDTTVTIGLPLANDEFVQAFVRWKDQVQCAIRCNDPTGGGNQGTLSCPGGGTANWSVDLQILAGQANSYFTYSGCNFTTAEGDQFTVSGQFAQFSDFDGNGTEQGSVDVGEGDFVGVVEAHTVFSNKNRSGGYFRAGCLSDPLPDQDCLPAPGMVNVYYPDWTCQNDECGTPPPYVDSDGDGVFDRYDNCPNDSNPNQANSDFDNEGGDACDTPEVGDNDGDLIPDSGDNCPNTANQDQLDTDGDGQGDVCDTYPNDVDNDGFSDDVDNCPLISNPAQEDNDNDGEGNECDLIPDVASVLLVTYGRGIGTIPGTSCGDMEEDAGLCYEYCAEGFDGVGPVCWNEREHSYGRGVGDIPDDIWNQTCPEGEENDAGLCYPICDAGYHGVGPVCWLDTISYGRGVGTIPDFVCDADEDKDAGLCYPKCEVGYNGVGPVCWAPMEDILEGLIIDLTETFPFLADMFQ